MPSALLQWFRIQVLVQCWQMSFHADGVVQAHDSHALVVLSHLFPTCCTNYLINYICTN